VLLAKLSTVFSHSLLFPVSAQRPHRLQRINRVQFVGSPHSRSLMRHFRMLSLSHLISIAKGTPRCLVVTTITQLSRLLACGSPKPQRYRTWHGLGLERGVFLMTTRPLFFRKCSTDSAHHYLLHPYSVISVEIQHLAYEPFGTHLVSSEGVFDHFPKRIWKLRAVC
jgi:hypothetical protein